MANTKTRNAIKLERSEAVDVEEPAFFVAELGNTEATITWSRFSISLSGCVRPLYIGNNIYILYIFQRLTWWCSTNIYRWAFSLSPCSLFLIAFLVRFVSECIYTSCAADVVDAALLMSSSSPLDCFFFHSVIVYQTCFLMGRWRLSSLGHGAFRRVPFSVFCVIYI